MLRINHDISTGQITEVPLAENEIVELKTMAQKSAENLAARAAAQAEAEAAKATAQAKLAALGLTTDDLKALGL